MTEDSSPTPDVPLATSSTAAQVSGLTDVRGKRSAIRRGLDALPRNGRGLKRALSLFASLHDLGWHRSAALGAPVGADGQPFPWYTYPALLWLGPRLRKSDVIFEYGAGNSSRWFASRVARVVSVEHDADWASAVHSSAAPNMTVLHRGCSGDGLRAPAGDRYVEAIGEVEEPLDVVVVDGMARVACVEAAIPRLGSTSLLVLDNADRPGYRDALDELAAAGLLRIDFIGPVPGSGRLSCTSVFARDFSPWLSVHPVLPHLGY